MPWRLLNPSYTTTRYGKLTVFNNDLIEGVKGILPETSKGIHLTGFQESVEKNNCSTLSVKVVVLSAL